MFAKMKRAKNVSTELSIGTRKNYVSCALYNANERCALYCYAKKGSSRNVCALDAEKG